MGSNPFIKTPKKYRLDQKSILVFDFPKFAATYLPKKMVHGRKVIDAGCMKDRGLDARYGNYSIDKLLINGPLFLVNQVYARDAWQAVQQSYECIQLFLSVADLSGGLSLFEKYPLSSYPKLTLCFVFEKPETTPQGFGRWTYDDWLSPYVFDPRSVSKILKVLNSLSGSKVWPIIRSALHAFRRATCQIGTEETLVDLWTACEILAAAGDRQIRDEDAAKTMKKIFKATWYEFPEQVDAFLNARNRIVHESNCEAQWSHVFFSRFLFERLIAILIGYAKKGKSLADICAIFAAAKLGPGEAGRMYAALREQMSPSNQDDRQPRK